MGGWKQTQTGQTNRDTFKARRSNATGFVIFTKGVFVLFRNRVWLSIPLLALLFCLPEAARAGDTTVGVTLNGTTGHHVEANGTQIVPFVPVPIFKIEHKRKNLAVRAEILPPIGPIALGQNGGFGAAWAPRVSFLSADALYTLPNGRLTLGVGETIVNQRIFFGDTGLVQASRVVGARYLLRSLLYATPFANLQADLAVNPSMHGVQYTMLPAREIADGEVGSMVDGSMRWSVPARRYTFAYGLRYINYTARYSMTGRLADHNHLLMPFIGVDVHLNPLPARENTESTPALRMSPSTSRSRNETRIGFSVYGISGSHDRTYGDSEVTPFGLSPAFEFSTSRGRLEADIDAILPARRANLFGQEGNTWSYLDAGLRYFMRNRRSAFGISDTSINQNLTRVIAPDFIRTHHEGLRYSPTAIPFETLRQRFEISLGVVPYLHASSYYSTMVPPTGYVWCPACPPLVLVPHTFTQTHMGALFDSSLRWIVARGPYDFSYGVRYINQTLTLDSRIPLPDDRGPYSIQQHDTSFMPFVGITTRLGRKP